MQDITNKKEKSAMISCGFDETDMPMSNLCLFNVNGFNKNEGPKIEIR